MSTAIRLCLVGTVLVAISSAVPVVADDMPEYWADICEEYLENHPHDPEWAEACIEGMYWWELQNPPTNYSPPPPREVFPYDRVQIPAGQHDGDKASIAQKLLAVIVEIDAADLRDEIHGRALDEGLRSLSPDMLAEKAAGYALLKSQALAGILDIVPIRDYANLPVTFVQISSKAALDELVDRSEVRAVHENREYEAFLGESLDLIEQPAAEMAGRDGAGVTIAVLDTGADYTEPPFNCTAAGTPGCRIVDVTDATLNGDGEDRDNDPNGGALNGHGTNVSAIAAETAVASDLIVADVFDGQGSSNDNIINGVNWVMMNRAQYNVVAMNLSLGTPEAFPGECDESDVAIVLGDALAAGIQPVVASGNAAYFFGSFRDGVADPACVPAAVSVGAVYDDDDSAQQNWRSGTVFQCSDPSMDTDEVPCASQTAPILDFLAPGAWITAGGMVGGTRRGTSMAAPHAAGAWAIAEALTPGARSTLGLLQEIGEPRTDPRPSGSRTTPRIDLLPEPGSTSLVVFGALAVAALARHRTRR